jgi:HPt (histidine-containing phosphotransfer) domain-containing protein
VVVSDQQLADGLGSDLCRWLLAQCGAKKLAGLPFFVLLSAEPVHEACAQACFVKPLLASHWFTVFDGVKKRQAKKTEKSKKIVCKKVIHDKIPSVLTELLPKFASEMRAGLGDLEQALARADWARMSELTHKIKGSCMLFGLQSWVEVLLALQTAINNQSSGQARAQLAVLRAAVARFDA